MQEVWPTADETLPATPWTSSSGTWVTPSRPTPASAWRGLCGVDPAKNRLLRSWAECGLVELESTGPSWCGWSLGDDGMGLGSSLSPHRLLMSEDSMLPFPTFVGLTWSQSQPHTLHTVAPRRTQAFHSGPSVSFKDQILFTLNHGQCGDWS